MNFKDEYQKAFSDIKADEAFRQKLLKEMKREKKRRKNYAYVGVMAAAAVMLLVVGIAVSTGILKGRQEPVPDEGLPIATTGSSQSVEEGSEIMTGEVVAGQGESGTHADMDFSSLSWYGDADDEEELLEIFSGLIKGNTLKAIYTAMDESYEEQSQLSDEESRILLERLGGLACTEAEYTGNSTYYKAVFESGVSIKFKISENGLLQLKDTGEVYVINE